MADPVAVPGTAGGAGAAARGQKARERQALLLGILGVVIFGLTLPATRLAVAELDPLFVTAGRSLVAAGLACLALLWARPRPPHRREWPRLAAFAGFSIIGCPLLMAIAMQYAPASHGAVVLAVLPLLTAMGGALVAGERPSLGFWACGFAGTVAVLAYSLVTGAGSGDLQWADLLLAVSAFCAAMAYALGGEILCLEQGACPRRDRQGRADPAAAAVRGTCSFCGAARRDGRLARGRLRGAGGCDRCPRLAHAGCEAIVAQR